MKVRFFSEKDNWTADGAKITSPDNLENIRRVLEGEAPIIVEHWFYRGSSAPDRMVFDDFDDFMDYLKKNASAGDALNVWNFGKACKEKNRLAHGKCPDDQDQVPQKGAY